MGKKAKNKVQKKILYNFNCQIAKKPNYLDLFRERRSNKKSTNSNTLRLFIKARGAEKHLILVFVFF
jgi:hypothetical protein